MNRWNRAGVLPATPGSAWTGRIEHALAHDRVAEHLADAELERLARIARTHPAGRRGGARLLGWLRRAPGDHATVAYHRAG